MLVTRDWLAQHARDHNVRLFDCTGHIDMTTSPPRALSGRALYDRGHLPDAAYLDLLGRPQRPPTPRAFYPLRSPQEVAQSFGALGIARHHHVVLYSSLRPSWATRAWWLLRLHGHTAVSVLQDGWEGWVREGRPVALDAHVYPSTSFELTYRPQLLARAAAVARASTRHDTRLVSALSPEQFSGSDTTIHYGRPGHIPTSANLPYTTLLNASLTGFRHDRGARQALERIADGKRKVIAYCGGGVGATALAFAWALHGRTDVAVYNGSMIDWAADASHPVHRGTSPP